MAEDLSIKAIQPVSTLGEGPHWQQEYQALTYVDIESGKLYRYFPKTGRLQQLYIEFCETGKFVSFVLPVKGRPDLLVIGHGRDVAAVKWPADAPDSSATKPVSFGSVDSGKATRFNDAKCDSIGRIWAGTMGLEVDGSQEPRQGTLYRYNSSLQPTACVEEVSISNGLAWSHDNKTMYYIDTPTHKISAFDYDVNTGDISNRRTLMDYKNEDFPTDWPDGMTIDTDGNLWVAHFASYKIIQIDPVQKKVLRKIPMPSKNMTSVCFGGPDFSTLYATSAAVGVRPEELAKAPQCGMIFEIKGTGAKGMPPYEAVLDTDIIAKIDA